MNAENKMSSWLKPNHAEVILTLREEEPLLNQTLEIIRNHEIDWIIIGSKGQTASSVALLGSHTIKLLKGNDLIPVLIIKMRGENYNLLQGARSM